jgi:hypothetical protein
MLPDLLALYCIRLGMLSRFNRFRISKKTKTMEENPPQFPLFPELPDPVQFHVVSFLATAPQERIFDGEKFGTEKGTLSTVFPFVCKKFQNFARSERLWKMCLERALTSDKVWSAAITRMAPDLATHRGGNQVSALLEFANVSSCQNLYKVILNEHIRLRLPIFFMPMQFDTDTPHPRYNLHFFEPRYRIMMAELMEGFDRNPGDNGPVFLHVVDMRGPSSKVAALVRVLDCIFAHDGRCVA